MSSSLETLITKHRETLTSLYTSISPTPSPLVETQLTELESLLSTKIEEQRSKAEAKRDTHQLTLDINWKKVNEWRVALGENVTQGKQRGTGPLLSLIDEVEGVLQGMRGRMEERGKAILGLNTRLSSFVDVLGVDWFGVKLDNIEDGWEGLDLRLERMSALERELMRCEAEIAQRRDTIGANVNEIFALRSELGIHQGDGSTAPDDFDEAILAHLGIGEGREKKELQPTSENIKRVEAKRTWLEEEKNQRNAIIQSTYDKLYPLWTMLGVSEFDMEQFVNSHMGSTQDVVTGYQDELTRMLTLKRSNLSAFIARERASLSSLWDMLYLSAQQRLASFPPYSICVDSTRVWNEQTGTEEEVINNNVSEELLIAHERERERVEQEIERCQPVLERLARYFSVVEEMSQLEASASDPSRLLGKSTRGDPGRLLREEKARKRVVKEKPRLEAELRQFIPAWEQQNQRPFLVNGVRFLDDLENKMEAEIAEKESKKREKLGKSTSSSTSSHRPLQSQTTGASSMSGPIKRQMTGRSVTGGSSSSSGPPAAKRQAPMTTGASTRSALGDHNGQYHQPQQPMIVGGPTKLMPQATGMKLPAGWGAPATASMQTIPNQGYENMSYGQSQPQQYTTTAPLRPQPTGGFRPGQRTSGNSSIVASVGAWSARVG